ncbi:hypothetical protein B0T20DRAFT_365362 [Sordaria brevicollis]|uniref:Uncharacterized protein n=1 Tax=Sordaria brevicollis TaxID=83679 RepID=A0AAE0U2F7_SORBR|nr:hypothetical protein B0T20DRAFT_365362 [Sordaria brevicollis]
MKERKKKSESRGWGLWTIEGRHGHGPQHCRLGITQPSFECHGEDIWYGIVTDPYCFAGVCITCNYVSCVDSAWILADMPTPVHAPGSSTSTGQGAKSGKVPPFCTSWIGTYPKKRSPRYGTLTRTSHSAPQGATCNLHLVNDRC